MSEERILVVGGRGFIGFHIVKSLLEVPSWSVHVLSRNPSQNQVKGAHYHTGSISLPKQLSQILAEVRPSVVLHAASPTSAGNIGGERQYQETNVKGTYNLLKAAIASGHVKAFVYTSSAEVIDVPIPDSATEDAPIYTASSKADYYARSKAIADQMVLDGNRKGGVRTLCLRLVGVYGERDSQVIPGYLQVLREGRHRYQIGDNTSLIDFVSATNVALAHVLAIRALLSNQDRQNTKVDGEAFFITDGRPIPFWTFARKVWAAAGDRTRLEEVTVIPAWLMLYLSSVVEWIYWVFTFGLRRPKVLKRQQMNYTCLQHTYSIVKAKERLQYEPLDDRDLQIRKGVEWLLRTEAEASSKENL